MSATVLFILRLAAAIALYAFLGWAFYTLWLSLRRKAETIMSPRVPTLTLVGPLEEDGIPRATSFSTPEVLIGRDPASDCYLENKTISARHARLRYHLGNWWIEDLKSTNGTFLNQEPVTQPLVLSDGDQLRFGSVSMQVSMQEEVSPHSEIEHPPVAELWE